MIAATPPYLCALVEVADVDFAEAESKIRIEDLLFCEEPHVSAFGEMELFDTLIDWDLEDVDKIVLPGEDFPKA